MILKSDSRSDKVVASNGSSSTKSMKGSAYAKLIQVFSAPKEACLSIRISFCRISFWKVKFQKPVLCNETSDSRAIEASGFSFIK